MNYLTRQTIKSAIRNLRLALAPKSKENSKENDNILVTHILHTVKNEIDIATFEINGSTSTERTSAHEDTEKRSEILLNEYFENGDLESIHALASGLIAQLSEKQAEEHHKAFEEHLQECFGPTNNTKGK